MRNKIIALILAFVAPVFSRAAEVPKIDVRQAAQRVEVNKAILIDVREPSEWKETGVAAPAVLLAKSDFDGTREAWQPFLKKHPPSSGVTLILYCRSGRRAGAVGEALAEMGYAVANAGGLNDWEAAGLPKRQPDEK